MCCGGRGGGKKKKKRVEEAFDRRAARNPPRPDGREGRAAANGPPAAIARDLPHGLFSSSSAAPFSHHRSSAILSCVDERKKPRLSPFFT